ncbi:hypothetical protein [Persephonella sp.]
MNENIFREIEQLSDEVSRTIQKTKNYDEKIAIFKVYYKMLMLMEKLKLEESYSCKKFRKFMGLN